MPNVISRLPHRIKILSPTTTASAKSRSPKETTPSPDTIAETAAWVFDTIADVSASSQDRFAHDIKVYLAPTTPISARDQILWNNQKYEVIAPRDACNVGHHQVVFAKRLDR